MIVLLLLSLLNIFNHSGASTLEDAPNICLERGACYQGAWKIYDDLRYASFQGIRYAQAPSGNLRFKPPVAYFDTEGVFDVSEDLEIGCPQLYYYPTGQEDCLLLNVYVPEQVFTRGKANDETLPVMVWIHGGALMNGWNAFGSAGPNEFMRRDVIMVSINYRLGAFGFLSLGNEDVPGNMGMRDQNMALRWVNQNIANFGGNPQQITIFGESAGALSVAYQVISPLSKGLFQRAIIQSGPAINPSWGRNSKEQANTYGNMLLQALNCEGTPNNGLDCLQSKSMDEVINAMFLNFNNPPSIWPDVLVWVPVPDSDYISDPFLPEDPETLLKTGQFNTDVDVIIGSNSDEGLLILMNAMTNSSLWEDYQKDFEIGGTKTLFAIAQNDDITAKDIENANKLLKSYVGSVDEIDQSHGQNMIDMLTDSFFLFGTQKSIKYMQDQGMNVYQYVLSYEYSQGSGFGVNHAEDTTYIFNPPFGVRPDCCQLR